MDYALPFDQLSMRDVAIVGGKNASLGEMIKNLSGQGILVPQGFATTAHAYAQFLESNQLGEKIQSCLKNCDVSDVQALSAAGEKIRGLIMNNPFHSDFEQSIRDAYRALQDKDNHEPLVAVRSSATAEDLPEASFAGQQETFLNICGIEQVLMAIRKVFASLFTDRAIAYREHQHMNHQQILLSAGIQRMVRSDIGASGVMFTLDTESGFDQVVFITSSYGLGEMIVQGEINPDEFYVHKPTLSLGYQSIVRKVLGTKEQKMIVTQSHESDHSVMKISVPKEKQHVFSLSDEQVMQLAHYAMIIESHYGRHMDIEWGLDGENQQLYILQARPETVISRKKTQIVEHYVLKKQNQKPLITGRSIGRKIGSGVARVLTSIDEMNHIKPGDVLVTDMTDPDWEPVLKKVSAIVTNRGGRTCHAAIVAREMGIPAVVGCNEATLKITDHSLVTVSCAEGDTGYVYPEKLDFEVETMNIEKMPDIPIKIMLNVANPDHAFSSSRLPNNGIGLARLEFIIGSHIGFHPKALLHPELLDQTLQQKIKQATSAYPTPVDFYVDKLAEGIATIAAGFYPKPVIVRLSDFKSNEYAHLIGGHYFEPKEENPMIGLRGALRYLDDSFRDCFELECKAIKKAREMMGLTNIQLMIPFVRTVTEAKRVIQALSCHGLTREKQGLKIIMMCEIPSNALLAEQFLSLFDGFSIGSNDMTQLTLGLDRDSALVANSFDEQNEAVKTLFSTAIQACKKQGKYSGICGQAPSDYPDFAVWLVKQGIESISLNPDTVVKTWLHLANFNQTNT